MTQRPRLHLLAQARGARVTAPEWTDGPSTREEQEYYRRERDRQVSSVPVARSAVRGASGGPNRPTCRARSAEPRSNRPALPTAPARREDWRRREKAGREREHDLVASSARLREASAAIRRSSAPPAWTPFSVR
jgi:hypothetical protein